jgi:Fe-S-cluster-containing dehydrogenase component
MRIATPETGPAFLLDLDLCVGCHACVVACANENRLSPGRSWRQIVSYNPSRLPDCRVYHLSLACNHCLDAPCMEGCPALAITHDERTGAVILDSSRCIGCRYCSLVCPFDAPQFNVSTGVMEKCSFCNERLLRNEAPACTSMCPTKALTAGPYEEPRHPPIDGFPDTRYRPAISFRPMRARRPQPPPPGVTLPDPVEYAAWTRDGAAAIPEKISLASEWSLAIFTFMVVVLVGWLAASWGGGPPVDPLLFSLGGAGSLVLSALHLGRQGRAWRAILNWRRSWLSREVLAFPLLLLTAAPALFSDRSSVFGLIALGLGAATLVSIDRVYARMARDRFPLDDHAALLSSLFLAGVFAGIPQVALPAGVMRMAALADRWRRERPRYTGRRATLGLLEISFLGASAGAWMAEGVPSAAVLLFAGLGELADRLDFYRTFSITTPRRLMARTAPGRERSEPSLNLINAMGNR